MPTHLEQHDVVEGVFTLPAGLPQIHQLLGVGLIGEKTAATGGLSIILDTKPLGQRHLRLSRAPGKVVQLFATNPPLALGKGRA